VVFVIFDPPLLPCCGLPNWTDRKSIAFIGNSGGYSGNSSLTGIKRHLSGALAALQIL
jgi:hypothetical protein